MIFNELEYAKHMLKSGFLQDKYLMELKLLAKYYNKVESLKTNDVKIKLKDFCDKYLPEYNEVLHLEMIAKATHYGVQKKNILVIIPPIPITKNELDKIKELNNLDLKKLAFVGLVLSKINIHLPKKKNNKNDNAKNNSVKTYYVNNIKDLFKYAKVSCNKDNKEKYLNQLYETELFGINIFGSLEVKFVDEISEAEFIIKNFESFVLEYLRYIGHNVVYCENCQVPFIPSNGSHKYCRTCAKEIKKLQNRIADKKYKNKKRENRQY